ncbi:DUF2335 domain-containing protein [Flectobacillus sp. DC10W]|uniref:DUF2335 domain-containing protein n=1 Tax=Flectobacillus longus TaxID=2984207 RepID=A0ABT6YLI6_9BACT|nr:DUF2335 domain-containing protein [Flectobacillus longus]MDI9864458.1 DUF2335 domain-containing protein [Flectobacillus longus]
MKNKQAQKVQAQVPSNVPERESNVTLEKHSYYEGPLPHPQILSEYKEVNPTFPERIMDSFESEGKHRRAIENKIVNFGFTNQIVGILAALIAIAMVFYVAILFMEKGHATEASAILCTVVIGLAAVFLGRKIGEKNKTEK